MNRKVIHFVSPKDRRDPKQEISREIEGLERLGIIIPEIDCAISETARIKIIKTTYLILIEKKEKNKLKITPEELKAFQEKWIGKAVARIPNYSNLPTGKCVYAGISLTTEKNTSQKVVKLLLWVESFIHAGNAIPGQEPNNFEIVEEEDSS